MNLDTHEVAPTYVVTKTREGKSRKYHPIITTGEEQGSCPLSQLEVEAFICCNDCGRMIIKPKTVDITDIMLECGEISKCKTCKGHAKVVVSGIPMFQNSAKQGDSV